MVKRHRIIWKPYAKTSLKNIYTYIKISSPSAALKVRNGIVAFVESLNDFPGKYSKEEYLKEERADIRSVTIWSYKIVYEVTSTEIFILDIFHVSRNPLKMKK